MSPKDITFEQLFTSGLPASFDTLEIIFFIPILLIVSFMVFLMAVSISRFFKKESYEELSKTLDILGFKKSQQENRIEGCYKEKDITISLSFPRATHSNLLIETSFYCNIPKIKHKLFPTTCFSLVKRKEFVAKWNGFEKSFRTFGKVNLDLSEKTKLNLEYLYCKKYFIFITSLEVKLPNSKKLIQMRKGKVVFNLPRYIIKDPDSLKIAMDIVVDVAKQMDEMKMGK